MNAAVALVAVALWLLGGHLRDDALGRAVRGWTGPGVAVALVTDGFAVAAVVAVGAALLVATLVACLRRGNGGSIPADTRELLELAERESRSRFARELRSTFSSDEQEIARG